MHTANIVLAIVSALWFALFLLGRDLMQGVYLQGQGVAPHMGQIDYYVVYPLIAVVMLLVAGWAGNAWRKPRIVLIPSFVLGGAILPFMLGYTGGM